MLYTITFSSGNLELAAIFSQDLVLKDQNHPAALTNYAASLMCKDGSIVAGMRLKHLYHYFRCFRLGLLHLVNFKEVCAMRKILNPSTPCRPFQVLGLKRVKDLLDIKLKLQMSQSSVC